jgi:exodeoxyribonuclease VII large subunit
MQGEGIERSIIEALNSINAVCDDYDAVVIIRGGGATSDMAGFDTLALAENVANFPIPIITGIGHDRDESILDMVSHTRVKTPTAAAAFLIDHLKTVLDQLTMLSEAIPRLFSVVRTRQEARLDNLYQRILMRVQQRAVTSQADIRNLEQGLLTALQRRLTSEHHRLEMLEEKVRSLDPALLLKRGYSMTLFNGKAVRDPQTLRQGDEIETRLEKGTIKSIIK